MNQTLKLLKDIEATLTGSVKIAEFHQLPQIRIDTKRAQTLLLDVKGAIKKEILRLNQNTESATLVH